MAYVQTLNFDHDINTSLVKNDINILENTLDYTYELEDLYFGANVSVFENITHDKNEKFEYGRPYFLMEHETFTGVPSDVHRHKDSLLFGQRRGHSSYLRHPAGRIMARSYSTVEQVGFFERNDTCKPRISMSFLPRRIIKRPISYWISCPT